MSAASRKAEREHRRATGVDPYRYGADGHSNPAVVAAKARLTEEEAARRAEQTAAHRNSQIRLDQQPSPKAQYFSVANEEPKDVAPAWHDAVATELETRVLSTASEALGRPVSAAELNLLARIPFGRQTFGDAIMSAAVTPEATAAAQASADTKFPVYAAWRSRLAQALDQIGKHPG